MGNRPVRFTNNTNKLLYVEVTYYKFHSISISNNRVPEPTYSMEKKSTFVKRYCTIRIPIHIGKKNIIKVFDNSTGLIIYEGEIISYDNIVIDP